MIYTQLTKKAMRIAYEVHKDQVDKAGAPYIFHPFYIAEQMDTEEEMIVALLHDVLEDGNLSIEELRSCGFSECALDAICCLTYDGTLEYMDYIIGIRPDPLATKVKLADLRHNSDITRLDLIDDKANERTKRYKWAIEVLLASDGELQIWDDRIRKHIPLDDERLFFLSIYSDKK